MQSADLVAAFEDIETKLSNGAVQPLVVEDPDEWKPKRQPLKLTYQKKNRQPAFVQDGRVLIYRGEVFTLIAAPGGGKSNWVENSVAVILSQMLGIDYHHTLGLTCPCVTSSTRVLVCDLERPTDDVDTSHKRIYRRLGNAAEITKDDQLIGLDYVPMIDLDDIDQTRSEIVGYLKAAQNEGSPYDFVFLDGGLDLCEDMNDSKLAPAAARWIRWLAANFNAAVLVTLHPNKNSETAAGAYGTYLNRYSRAFLLIKSIGVDGTRVLTNDFDLNKTSHASGRIEHYFSWNPELGFFTSIDSTPVLAQKHKRNQSPDLEQTIREIFKSRMTVLMPALELKPLLMKKLGCKESQVKIRLAEAIDFGYLEKEGDRRLTEYRLVVDS